MECTQWGLVRSCLLRFYCAFQVLLSCWFGLVKPVIAICKKNLLIYSPVSFSLLHLCIIIFIRRSSLFSPSFFCCRCAAHLNMLCNYAIRNLEKYGTRVDPVTNQVCATFLKTCCVFELVCPFESLFWVWSLRSQQQLRCVQQFAINLHIFIICFLFPSLSRFPFSHTHNSHTHRWCSAVCWFLMTPCPASFPRSCFPCSASTLCRPAGCRRSPRRATSTARAEARRFGYSRETPRIR